jgi:acyl carrier protein
MRLLDAALVSLRAALVPVVLDVPALRTQAREGLLPPMLRGIAGRVRPVAGGSAPAAVGLALTLSGMDTEGRLRALTELVRIEAAVVLGIGDGSGVGPARAFREAGFDSLTSVELRNRLTAASGVKLPVTAVFDYPTPKALADHLHTELFGLGASSDLSDTEESELRSLLASVPLNRFREMGVLDALLRLAGEEDAPAPVAGKTDESAIIAGLDVDELIQRALGEAE